MVEDLVERFLPDFLGIGAQRAGSTWVWENLNRHPSVWTPSTKEKHFFDVRIKMPLVPAWSGPLQQKIRYASHFTKGRLLGKTVGEVTPAYAVLDRKVLREIRRWMPDVKLIYVMRDPLERIVSKAHKDFQNSMGIPYEEAGDETKREFFTLREVIDHSRYGTVLENWLSVFDRDQVHVLFTERMAGDPRSVLRNLYNFLELDPDPSIDWSEAERVVHGSGKSYRLPESLRGFLRSKLRDEVERLGKLLDDELPWDWV